MDELFVLSRGRGSLQPVPTTTQMQALEQSETGAPGLGLSPVNSVSQKGDFGEALTLSTHVLPKTEAKGAYHTPILKDGHGG